MRLSNAGLKKPLRLIQIAKGSGFRVVQIVLVF